MRREQVVFWTGHLAALLLIGVGGHQFQKIMTRNIKWNTLGLPKFIIFLKGSSIFSGDFCGELFLLFGFQNYPIWREKNHQHPPKHRLQTAALTHSLQTLDRDITSHALMGSVGLRCFLFFSIQWQMFWIQTTFCHFCGRVVCLVFGCGSFCCRKFTLHSISKC